MGLQKLDEISIAASILENAGAIGIVEIVLPVLEEWNTNVSDFEEAHRKFSEATHADPTGDHGDEPQPPYPDDAVTALKVSLSPSLSPSSSLGLGLGLGRDLKPKPYSQLDPRI